MVVTTGQFSIDFKFLHQYWEGSNVVLQPLRKDPCCKNNVEDLVKFFLDIVSVPLNLLKI